MWCQCGRRHDAMLHRRISYIIRYFLELTQYLSWGCSGASAGDPEMLSWLASMMKKGNWRNSPVSKREKTLRVITSGWLKRMNSACFWCQVEPWVLSFILCLLTESHDRAISVSIEQDDWWDFQKSMESQKHIANTGSPGFSIPRIRLSETRN